MRTTQADEQIRRGRLAKAKQFSRVAEDALLLSDEGDKYLNRLLGMKTRAGYGHDPVSKTQLDQAKRAVDALIEIANV